MIVYRVYLSDYEGDYLYGLFSSREKAEAYLKWHQEHYGFGQHISDLEIDEWAIDTPRPHVDFCYACKSGKPPYVA